jgi:hypothetical protein
MTSLSRGGRQPRDETPDRHLSPQPDMEVIVTNSPYGTFLHGAATGDAVLLQLFECWNVAAGGEVAVKSERARNRAHARLRQLEERIRETPAQGLTGIAVKLALRRFIPSSRALALARFQA